MRRNAQGTRPNILIFMVDQMPFDIFDSTHPCQMPNLEKLAAEGLSFNRAFSPSPHCCPARATFMTGLYPSRHGVFNNVKTNTAFQAGLNPGVTTFAEPLIAAGYHLAIAGKYHITNEETPSERGWEELSPFEKYASNETDWRAQAARPEGADEPRPFGTAWRPGWGDTRVIGDVHPPREDRSTESPDDFENTGWYKTGVKPAIEFLQRPHVAPEPWLLFASTDQVPWSEVPQDIADMYDPADMPLPESFADTLEDKPNIYRRMQQQIWGQYTDNEVRASIAHYCAVCTMQDRYFGEILGALDASGQAENTLVLFIADHGDYLFAHGLREMGIPAFREAYHVPAVMRWPAGLRNPNRTVDDFVTLADFAPTFVALARDKNHGDDTPLTGRSLVPFIQDEPTPTDWPDAVFSQSNGNECYFTQRYVQTGRYKYVCNWFDFDELYDLEHDPHEMVNLAHPSRAPVNTGAAGQTRSTFTPWPHLGADIEAIRQDMIARMWRFAERENDTIFNGYPTVAIAAYGPMIGL